MGAHRKVLCRGDEVADIFPAMGVGNLMLACIDSKDAFEVQSEADGGLAVSGRAVKRYIASANEGGKIREEFIRILRAVNCIPICLFGEMVFE